MDFGTEALVALKCPCVPMVKMRVLIADDHLLMRAGLRTLLQSIPEVDVVAEADNGLQALELIAAHQPTLALFDITMPLMNGLDATERICQDFPGTHVVMLSMHTGEDYVRRALKAGARGYLLKDSDPSELRTALETVSRGEVYLSPAVAKHVVSAYLRGETTETNSLSRLTPRLREVLQLLAEGHRTKAIAQAMKISIRTVESHRAQLMEELEIHELAGLVKYAIRMGLVTSDA